MEYYKFHDISRRIWTSTENIVLIYVGSAAEFALNPEVDWLFYTMRLPNDPQKRFVETFKFNQKLILATPEELPKLAQIIRHIHEKLSEKRSADEHRHVEISNSGFKQVGNMLIEYGIRGFEYLQRRKMTDQELEDYYQDMRMMMQMMGIHELPEVYAKWREEHERSVKEELAINKYTKQLYDAYRRDVGPWRYWLLRRFQAAFINPAVTAKLDLPNNWLVSFLYKIYPFIPTQWDWQIIKLVLLKRATRVVLADMETRFAHT